MSIAERIAALNVGHVNCTHTAHVTPRVGRSDVNAMTAEHPPALPVRSQSTDPRISHDAGTIGNEPDRQSPRLQSPTTHLIPPVQSKPKAPVLPPRRTSEITASDKDSVHSISSNSSSTSIKRLSTASSVSSADSKTVSKSQSNLAEPRPSIPALRLPTYDPKTLPPLPQKQVEQKKQPPPLPNRITNDSITSLKRSETSPQYQPHLPQSEKRNGNTPEDGIRSKPEATLPQRSALEWGLNRGPAYNKSFVQANPPPIPNNKPSAQPQAHLNQPDTSNETLEDIHAKSSVKSTLPTKSALNWGMNKGPAYDKSFVQATSPPQPANKPSAQYEHQPRLPGSTKPAVAEEAPKAIPQSNLPRKSALDWGMNKGPAYNKSFVQPAPTSQPANDAPPPVPLASRPNLAQLQASKPKPAQEHIASPTQLTQQPCLHCRDFSGPDIHASRFPRTAIPSTEISWLAHALTSPFTSATDKARVIFTWLHHNIAYDVVAFFSRNIRPSTPASTISSGLAVCEGYAGLFTALAIASGLESIVVSGHGKGFGYTPVQPNSPLPAFEMNHAWSAVKLDDGVWKLVDSCWGAGAVCDNPSPKYTPHFNPHMFSVSNADFGRRHFPQNQAHFFLPPGLTAPTWEEYLLGPDSLGEDVQIYGMAEEERLSAFTFSPSKKHIPLASLSPSDTVRFQFAAVCPHWYTTRPSYVFALSRESSGGGGGRELVPFRRAAGAGGGGGGVWWVDVPTRELGRRGDKVSCVAVDTVDGVDARGMDVEVVAAAVGRKGMSWKGVAQWVVA